jgi:hypothetical protein
MGKGPITPQHKKRLVMKCYAGPQNWADSFEQLRKWKMDMKTVASKLAKCKLDLWQYKRSDGRCNAIIHF